MTELQRGETGMSPQGMALSPDKAKLLLIGHGSSRTYNVAHYPLVVTGTNVARWSSAARRDLLGNAQTGAFVQFSLLAPYFYFLDSATLWANAYNNGGPPTALAVAGVPVQDIQYATPAPGVMLVIKKGSTSFFSRSNIAVVIALD